MTAEMLPADARLSASIMIKSSMRWSLTDPPCVLQMLCATKTSPPRTDCLISTRISPSENREQVDCPSSQSRSAQIARANSGLELPANTMKPFMTPSQVKTENGLPGPFCREKIELWFNVMVLLTFVNYKFSSLDQPVYLSIR